MDSRIRNYLYASTETNTRYHRINIDLNDQVGVATTFQLGVYTNPYVIDENLSVSFDLIGISFYFISFEFIIIQKAWAPDF